MKTYCYHCGRKKSESMATNCCDDCVLYYKMCFEEERRHDEALTKIKKFSKQLLKGLGGKNERKL